MSHAKPSPDGAERPPAANADYNLLFGVLALQLELIDSDQFAKASAAWATQKQKPLVEVFREFGWLTEEQCQEVDRLVQRKLKKHGGDATRTLAEAANPGGARYVRDVLISVADEDLRQTLGVPPASPSDPLQTTDYRTPARQSQSRYRLTRLYSEGGLGQVWLARDTDLDRDVAFKQIKPGRASQPEVWQRFLKEAKITGQLEHPNIVPVYELGHHTGTEPPFYTMRLVRGQTLREAIADYHRLRADGKEDPLARPKLLQAFVSVCQAINYAHNHGVIHRDIKPANVIIGKFGEVVVLDWGLAKVLGEVEEGATRIESATEGEVELTRAGQALGTPAYMAPEQAEGRIDLIDRRTDIYGLGGILFEILTGQPPHRGTNTAELMRQIVDGNTPSPRSIDPSVPRPLEAVCIRAMAKSRSDRYESPAALADDIQRWLADEPVTAFREPRRARLARRFRRNKGLLVAAAAVLLSVTLVSSLMSVVIYREKLKVETAEQVAVQEKLKAEEAEKAAVQEKHKAEGAEQAAVQEKLKAEEAEKIAVAQSQVAIDALGNMVMEVQNELEDIPGSFEVRRAILNRAVTLLTKLNDTPATTDRVIRRHLLAHMQIGDFAWALGDRDTAHKEYHAALDFAARAVNLNPKSDKARSNHMAMLVKVAESEQYLYHKLDDALARYEKAAGGWAGLIDKLRSTPAGDPALPEVERIDLAECERAIADCYDHIAKIYFASENAAERNIAKAEKYLNDGLAIRKRQLSDKPSREVRYRLGFSYLYLADLAIRSNDIERMVTASEELLKNRQSILRDFPYSLKAKRDVAEADLRLGDALYYAHQAERADVCYRDALKWYEQVMWSDPSSQFYRGRVCQSHYCVGCGALSAGDRKMAEYHFREALKLREEMYQELKKANRVTPGAMSTLMMTLARCGEHRRAVELAEQIRPFADPRVLAEEIGPTYGLCMSIIEAGRKPEKLTPDERKLRDHYHDMAIAAIKEGVSKGYNVILFLEGDPDMEPLLQLPEFRAWLAEFKKQLEKKVK